MLLYLIFYFFINRAYAQTGTYMDETPHRNCTLGGQDFNLNSSIPECHKIINPPCPTGYHLATNTPTPLPTPVPT